MKHFIDGDQVVITLDDFIDLQQSPAVFIPVDSEDGQGVIAGGILELPIGRLQNMFARLKHKREESIQSMVNVIMTMVNDDWSPDFTYKEKQ